jgi:hypothetical protein
MGGICNCGLRPSLPWFSTVGKPCLVVVVVQGAPPEKDREVTSSSRTVPWPPQKLFVVLLSSLDLLPARGRGRKEEEQEIR